MKIKEFEKWLVEVKAQKPNAAHTRANSVKKIASEYDVDKYYVDGKKQDLIDLFNYSKKDRDLGVKPLVAIKIDGDYYTGLASLKQALKLYYKFLDDTNVIVSSKPTTKFPFDEPILPQTGADDNGYYIRYAEDIEDNEKIPGLCRYLEGEYEMILAFVRKLIGDRVCDYNRIPVVLSKELPTEQYLLSSEEKAKMIDFKYRNGYKPSIKESEKIIDKDSITFPVFGRYFGFGADRNNDPYIVLYYKNFGTDDLELYKAKIAQTLAHEYMHHIHNLIAKDTFNGKGKYTEAVEEAVADFFGVLYSIWSHKNDKKIEVALDRYNTWVDYFGSNWPYANALWFLFDGDNLLDFSDQFDYYVNNCATSKFTEVVFESKNDMKKAYSVLTF